MKVTSKKPGVDTQSVPIDLYNRLQDQLQSLNTELETFRQRSPIVGIRWFGAGGFGITLTHAVNGVNKLGLQGYDDKAVIDYATWIRIRNTEHARFGLLVRDDKVIDELHIVGVVAKKDLTSSPNSLTGDETVSLLKGKLEDLTSALNGMTSHWGPIHLLHAAELLKVTTESKINAIKKKRDELSTEFRWSLLHPHDLKLACEQYKVKGWEDMEEDEMVHILARIELENNDEFI